MASFLILVCSSAKWGQLMSLSCRTVVKDKWDNIHHTHILPGTFQMINYKLLLLFAIYLYINEPCVTLPLAAASGHRMIYSSQPAGWVQGLLKNHQRERVLELRVWSGNGGQKTWVVERYTSNEFHFGQPVSIYSSSYALIQQILLHPYLCEVLGMQQRRKLWSWERKKK